ncbi:MAG: hypothetical protein RLZZ116_2140 [Planctomycetota bacterium]
MAVGQSASINFDNGYIDTGKTVGVEFLYGDTVALAVQFTGGGSAYQVINSTGSVSTSQSYTTGGLNIGLRRTGYGTYSLAFGNYSGSGTFTGGAATIDGVRVFNNGAGSGSDFDVFSNGLVVSCIDADSDGVCAATDCDDSNASVGAATTTYYRDADGDTYGTSGTTQVACTQPSGYVTNSSDCNDGDATIKPGATEICDGIDNDCDASIDEGLASVTYYRDADGDNYGNLSVTQTTCTGSAPTGYVLNSTDCNDANQFAYPGAAETCANDGTDNDCDGEANADSEASDSVNYFVDVDGDSYTVGAAAKYCVNPGSGFRTTSSGTDCNDSNAAVNPGATETCNTIDDDCDSSIDEGVTTTYYADGDGDGFGRSTTSQQACTAPTGYVTSSTDCNDNNAAIKPDATDICDGVDNNCDGTIDPSNCTSQTIAGNGRSGFGGPIGGSTLDVARDGADWVFTLTKGAGNFSDGLVLYFDTASGGFTSTSDFVDTGDYNRKAISGFSGSTGTGSARSVVNFPSGFTADYAIAVAPNARSQFGGLWRLTTLPTGSGSGHEFISSVNLVPNNSTTSATYTFRIARSGLGISSGGTFKMVGTYLNPGYAADGSIASTSFFRSNEGYGEGLPASNLGTGAATFTTFVSLVVPCTDVDNDGVCAENDCNDNDATIYAGATELCDNKDNDCDGSTDEGLTQYTYYRDADSDTFGSSTVTTTTCAATAPSGYVTNSSDCNDSAILYADTDGDGFGAGSPAACGVATNTDCGPSSAAIYPGAPELCGSVGTDNDCDSNSAEIDANASDRVAYYNDGDGDGVTTATATLFCTGAAGASYQSSASNPADCDDANPAVKPGAVELCSTVGTDNNCNGSAADVDVNASDKVAFYTDSDADTYTLSTTALFCPGTTNAGYRATISSPLDCNDGDATVYPTAPELCATSTVDNDCDADALEIDANAADKVSFYRDQDSDGISSNTTAPFCPGTSNVGYLSTQSSPADCDDTNKFVGTRTTYYLDSDNDTYGAAASPSTFCDGVVASWNFNSSPTPDSNITTGVTTASAGSGTLALIGPLSGTNPTYASGSTNDSSASDNSAVSITGLSNTSTGTHGVQFNISTVGYSALSFRLDVRGSSTTSKYWRVQYTTNRTASTPVWTSTGLTSDGLLELPGTTSFKNDNAYAIDPVLGADAANNPLFAIRVVAIFNPSTGAFSRNDSGGTAGTVSGGTMRFDMLTLNGRSVPSGYSANSTDCDDAVATVYPGAPELCSNLAVDNDCDGSTAESEATDRTTFYIDSDGDGRGLSSTSQTVCVQPTGYVANSNDCNDGNATIYTGAPELCDNLDNDCDTVVDDGIVFLNYYLDSDGDGYGASNATAVNSCSPVANSVTNNGDCNDSNAAIKPGATEVCDGVDNNCTGGIDEGVTSTFYADTDGDGYGNLASTTQACTAPNGYVANSGDCNDAVAGINPNAQEVCDSANTDEDCDSTADNADSSAADAGKTNFYRDQDGDGFTVNTATRFCDLPSGYDTAPEGDCNDGSTSVYPGAPELCANDGIDNDCDTEANADSEATDSTSYYVDGDSDGYGAGTAVQSCSPVTGRVSNNTDCDDGRATANPAASETCNGLDDDCDSTADEGLTFLNYYPDSDNDGYGASTATAQSSCSAVTGKVTNNTDCDDSRATANPAASELCNGLDDDCDSTPDDGLTFLNYYTDADNDGYGASTATAQSSCSAVTGKVTNNTDCDDARAAINPAASESCDGVDNNCDGTADAPSCTSITVAGNGNTGFGGPIGAGSLAISAAGANVSFTLTRGTGNFSDALVLYFDSKTGGFASTANFTDAPVGDYLRRAISGLAGSARSTVNFPAGFTADFAIALSPSASFAGLWALAENGAHTFVAGANLAPASSVNAASYTFAVARTDLGITGTANADFRMVGTYLNADNAFRSNEGFGNGLPASNPGTATVTFTSAITIAAPCTDADGDGFCAGVDCDDTKLLYADADNDGVGAGSATACGVTTNNDCAPLDNTIYPGAAELCTNLTVDNDCDGVTNEAEATDRVAYYPDTDGDGFGAGTSLLACTAPTGYVANATDGCPDNATLSSPATYYRDQDGDTYTTSTTTTACSLPTGYRASASSTPDCNDTNSAVNPGATESCNGLDDDCAGGVDNGLTFLNYYPDTDNDSFGSSTATAVNSCTAIAGSVTNNSDCNDGNPAIKPTAQEICDGGDVDEDCDGMADDADSSATGQTNWYADTDGDGAGAGSATSACNAPAGTVANANDQCPNNAALTAPATYYRDQDGDTYTTTTTTTACSLPTGYRATASGSADCDDANAAVNPGATESCNGIDDDCAGGVDNGLTFSNYYGDSDMDGAGDPAVVQNACSQPAGYVTNSNDLCPSNGSLVNRATYYRDFDADTYGDAVVTESTCSSSPSTGYVSNSGDCDDSRAGVNPAAQEVCDAANTDEDCDGFADNADVSATGKTNWYADTDNDGYGAGSAISACDAVGSQVAVSGDCDDTRPDVSPADPEVCDASNVDEDCDGKADDLDVQGASGKVTYYVDSDNDTYSTAATATFCDVPSTGYRATLSSPVDCNDAVAGINPGATEVCDAGNVDENCNNLSDNNDPGVSDATRTNFYRDQDGDGYTVNTATRFCDMPAGYEASPEGDCNDSSTAVNPGAVENCANLGTDNDCDGVNNAAEAVDATSYYVDTDIDGFGSNTATAVRSCSPVAGSVTNNSDCDDTRRLYADVDGDGFGAGASVACGVPTNTDCNDGSNAIFPGAAESCNGIDDDCDAQVDENITFSNYYVDVDGDGYGAAGSTPQNSCSPIAGRVTNASDCNDAVAAINPGAQEVCDLANTDEDCDGAADNADPSAADAGKTNFYRDQDGDGFTGSSVGRFCDLPTGYEGTAEGDCNDSNAAIFPTAVETCANLGTDNDCDGVNTAAEATDATNYYTDADNDSFGSSTATAVAGSVTNNSDCNDALVTYVDGDGDGVGAGSPAACGVATSNDCNDANNAIFPGAVENCANLGVNNDCDGDNSAAEAADATNYYVDADSDSFGSSTAAAVRSCSVVAGSVTNNSDCNDALVTYADGDNDGFGAGSAVACGVASNTDCNDANPAIRPNATETCDGVDQDCDGTADDGLTFLDYYTDGDGDGFGSPAASAQNSCAPVSGKAPNNTDCNDANATAFPGATELCNGFDDDCDNAIDEDVGAVSFYRDADGDGFGNSADSVQNCTGVAPAGYVANSSDCDDTRLLYADTDGDGFGAGAAVACGVATNTDCDPARATAYPGAAETCNGLDDDCDSAADDGLTFSNYYIDADGDGFGATGSTPVSACAPVAGRVLGNSGDCDDSRASVYPGAAETCNERDDDCDVLVDEGLPLVSYFPDVDGDTYGSDSVAAQRSCGPVAGKVANNLDCDDSRATAYFGAPELCNGLDDDCDSAADDGLTFINYYTDADADGYGATGATAQNSCAAIPGKAPNNTDCDDARAATNPGAAEVCNGIDDNCVGGIDNGLTFLNYYTDSDGDSYGVSTGTAQNSCNPVTGKVPNNLDCNDTNPAISPDATETCNGIDDNCTGGVDDGLTFLNYYSDADADTYGASNGAAQSSCNPVSGKVTNNLDCNDGNAAIRPGATETCNGVDDDCDAAIDDGLSFTTFYRDADGDGFGTSATTVQNCTGVAPTGYVSTGGDCDDTRVLYADVDGDGRGVGGPSACGAPVLGDNCPTVSNADQANCDSDGDGNACDANDDNDSVLDINDAYPCVAGQYRLDLNFSASQITAFLATATAATVDATGMDASQLAAIAAGAANLAPNGIIGTFTITAALTDLQIYAILGNIASSFAGGGPTVTVDGSAITGPPAYPEMDADQLGAVADNIGAVNSVQDVTLTADLDPAAIASIVNVAPNGEATIDATGMDASQLGASVSGASTVVIEGDVVIDNGVSGPAFTEILAQLASPASGTTVQFDTTNMNATQQAAVNTAISIQLTGVYCSLADADLDTYYTSACIVQYTDCNDNNNAVNPGNLPVLSGVPTSFSVAADAGTTLGAQYANPVTASDTCEGDLTSSIVLAISYPGGGSGTTWPTGGMFPVGVTTVTWSITDAINQTVTATRTITVQNYQLLDAAVTFGGVLSGSSSRQVRITHGGSSSLVTVTVPAGINPTAVITDMQVPVAAGYSCLAAKNTTHSLTDAAAPSIVAKQYAAAFTLRQGDANNDDAVDIFDYAAFITARGTGVATNASSNYNGDTAVSNLDFSFLSVNFLATGESCTASFDQPTPRTRVSVKDLRRAGLGDAVEADLNHDGWVDIRDIQLFVQSGGGANGGLDAPTDAPIRRW